MEEALVKRIMPNSLEAEQSVIASMIMDKEAIRLLKRLMYDAYHAELIEEAKKAVIKDVSKSVKEGRTRYGECEKERD